MGRSTKRGYENLPGAAGLRAWARRHAFSLLSSLGSLTRQPIASSMTVVVLGVALTLLLIDIIASLALSGRLRGPRADVPAALLLALFLAAPA
ncbi:MAG: hypothetical protein ACNA7J_14860, partial [Wenzhouxiangella sp.]